MTDSEMTDLIKEFLEWIDSSHFQEWLDQIDLQDWQDWSDALERNSDETQPVDNANAAL